MIEITALIFKKKDEDGKGYILDSILDKTGMKGTGMLVRAPHSWAACSCVQQIPVGKSRCSLADAVIPPVFIENDVVLAEAAVALVAGIFPFSDS